MLLTRHIWAGFGFLALALGVVGIFLPLLPTTPFLLLAAFCFSRSSERLHIWLVTHPRFGPIITNWNENGAIDRRSKIIAVFMMAAAFGLSVYMQLPAWVLMAQGVVLALVALFILSRPDGPRS